MYDFPRRRRESEGEVSSVLLFSAVLREIVSGCFHLLRSHGGKMISSEEVKYSEAGWLEGSKGQTCTADRLASSLAVPSTINQSRVTRVFTG